VGKDLYDENYKRVKKEIEEDTRKWKDCPCSWTSRINIVKMSIPTKVIPIKITISLFTKI
jgi:hypothetical protein